MKKILSLSTILIMVMALVGCNINDEPIPNSTGESKQSTLEGQQTVGTPNPFSEVESNEVFKEEIGISIDAPEGATNIEYRIYSNEIAQIDYDIDEKNFVLRASKTISGQELSGNHGDFEMISYIACGDTASVTVDTVELDDGSAFATSIVEMADHDTIYLALSCTNQITGDEISSMIDAMSYKIAEIN